MVFKILDEMLKDLREISGQMLRLLRTGHFLAIYFQLLCSSWDRMAKSKRKKKRKKRKKRVKFISFNDKKHIW